MSFELKILKAAHGDCIFIRGNFDGDVPRNILIDGGPSKVYRHHQIKGELFKELESIRDLDQSIDLLILTHVDDDHIGGLLSGFKNDGLLAQLTKKVWFNSGKLIFEFFGEQHESSNLLALENLSTTGEGNISISQGVTFESYIEEQGIWARSLILEGEVRTEFGAKFSFLSPTKEKLRKLLTKWEREKPDSLISSKNTDYEMSFDELLASDDFREDRSVHNGSSIAFIFEYGERRILLLGDAHDHIVVNSIKKKIALGESNKFELVKLSHHGSKYNTSLEFLNLIDCNKFVVSTDASKHGLPDKLTLARVYKSNSRATIYFNYPEIVRPKVFSEEEISYFEELEFNISEDETTF